MIMCEMKSRILRQGWCRKVLLTLLPLVTAAAALGQKTSFETVAPNAVATDEVFRVEYVLNAKPDQFTAPSAFEGFDVLAGPTTSQSQQISVVNGSMTQTFNYTYTYVLQPKAKGHYTIPSASVTVDGKSYTAKEVPIEVVEAEAKPQDAAGGEAKPRGAASIGKDDIMVRAFVDKTNVFKGQLVKVTFKIFTRLNMSGFKSYKFPAFNGFWNQELSLDGTKWQRETVDGKIYDSRVLGEYLLCPQQAGELYIEKFEATVVAQIVTQTKHQSMIDEFFSGGAHVEEVTKTVSTAPVKITVKELPSGAPAGFSGAVGKFTMTAEPASTQLAANSAGTFTVRISGSGNLPLIHAPKLTFPSSFEQYNVKTTESLRYTSSGINGYRQFEFPFIARAEGDYRLDPVGFSYFDPEQIKYVTLASEAYNLSILPDSTGSGAVSQGVVSGLNKEDIKILGQDIRFIKIGSAGFFSRRALLIGSPLYYVLILLLVALAVVSYIYLRKHIRENQNSVLVRNKKANKVALARFKAAAGHMEAGSQRAFYEEMLRALWGYMSDKLNIPVSNLTKDNIREGLAKRRIPADQIARFIDIISECEYAQYSPSASGQMQEVYAGAVKIISKFESVIKR